MDIALRCVTLLGLLAGISAWLWVVILACKKSPGWGVFALLFPPVGPIWFLVKHPREAAKPILLGLVGMVSVIVGIMATQP